MRTTRKNGDHMRRGRSRKDGDDVRCRGGGLDLSHCGIAVDEANVEGCERWKVVSEGVGGTTKTERKMDSPLI